MKLNRSVLILTGDNTVIQQEPIRGTIIIVVTVIKCNVIRKPGNREDLQPDVYKVQQHKWNLIKPDRWLYVLTANMAAICLTFGIQTHICLYCLIPSDTVQISNIHYFWKKKLLCIITKSVGMHTLPFPLMSGLCFFQVGVCPLFIWFKVVWKLNRSRWFPGSWVAKPGFSNAISEKSTHQTNPSTCHANTVQYRWMWYFVQRLLPTR